MLKDSEKSTVVDRFHVYCKMCFMHPDGRKICRYKKTISTGNLIAHLTEEHKIKSTQLSHQKVNIKRFFHSYGQSEQSSKSSKITERKKELSDSMTIWFCRDLIPFFEAEKNGLKDFLKIHGVVQNDLDLPHPSTLSQYSLSRVYNDCICAVKEKINEDNPSAISLTMDTWTDNYRHIPFMTFTLHWISPTETQLRSCTLQTSFLPHPHTADNIVEELKKVLTEFNLNDKIIILVTDGGTNMIKAAKIMKIGRVPCIAHGLHNLMMVDAISKLSDVNSLIIKARSIVKILAFKSYDIEKAKEIIQQEDINNILDNAENLEEILEADARFDSTLFKSNDHSYTQGFPSFGTRSGLHKDVSTRWNSTLEMLSSLLKNKEAVIRCLEMNKHYDAIPADNEWKEIEGVADCLISIKTATEILSGVEYPTTNLALLFRFCRWAQEQIALDPTFFNRVMFSDEATFQNTGELNRHNCHYYLQTNPHWVRHVDNQHRWKVNVWCGILDGHIVGPYFFEGNVNGVEYLDLLQNQLPEMLEDINLNTVQNMWIKQDGAGVHNARIVTNFLNDRYAQRWIGRNGFVAWPPRSPDLTSLDFYLWGYLKNTVYKTVPTTPEDLKHRIRTACRNISTEVLRKTIATFGRRIQLCIDENGGTFEQLL